MSRVQGIGMRERLPYKLEREEDETAKEISRTEGWMESVFSLLEAGRRDLAAASARSRAPEADAAADGCKKQFNPKPQTLSSI